MTRTVLAFFLFSTSLFAQATIELVPVASGLSSPIYVTNAHDRTHRLFIVEQGGIIKVLQPGASVPTQFLNITSRVLSGGEQGLLGLAFHPQYPTNGRFFVYYTRTGDGAAVIAEYAVSTNRNVALTTEIPILTIADPFANHNGGMMEFGSDGYLYIATGDGGSANDPGNRAQNINELLGKILRIDINTPNGVIPYSSPSTNPFAGATPGRDEIWAYGLRNPWRFSFDRSTRDLYIGDVGQGAWEEIDRQPASSSGGENYGWRVYEGNHCTNLDSTLCPLSGYTFPVTEYAHSGGRCSVTGGYVYRGARGSLPSGAYAFADYCTGELFLLQGTTQSLLLDTTMNISSFGESDYGEIFVVNLGGTVQRITSPSSGDTVGIYRQSVISFVHINPNVTGAPSRSFKYGLSTDIPITGDWDGNGTSTPGLFRDGTFYLRNSNTTGGGEIGVAFGAPGDIPIAGDWNGDGTDTVGIFRNGLFMLANSNTTGTGATTFALGAGGDLPVAGDWNGDGVDTVGIFRNGIFVLINSNTTSAPTTIFSLGGAGDLPVGGDWNGDDRDSVGIFRNGLYILINENRNGAPQNVFALGATGDLPVAGRWD